MASNFVSDKFLRCTIPTTDKITRQCFALTVMFAACVFATQAHAQFTPLAIGTATMDSLVPSCPTTAGWLASGTCKHITISNSEHAEFGRNSQLCPSQRYE